MRFGRKGLSMDEDNGGAEDRSDEYRIVDDDDRGPNLRLAAVVTKELIFCDPDMMLSKYGICGNSYSLDRLDSDGIKELSAFLESNSSIPEAEGIAKILDRARCNESFSIIDPSNVEAMFENDPACGSVYACNVILDSLLYALDITETIDTSSYALCILLGIKEGIIAEDELEDLTALFMYRNRCAMEIEVERPDDGLVKSWETILFRLVSMMFDAASIKGCK